MNAIPCGSRIHSPDHNHNSCTHEFVFRSNMLEVEQAPEVILQSGTPDVKSDIWSLGKRGLNIYDFYRVFIQCNIGIQYYRRKVKSIYNILNINVQTEEDNKKVSTTLLNICPVYPRD